MLIKKNVQHVDEVMTRAFMIWLSNIGYRGIKKSGEILFYCKVVNKRFPRNVVVMANGQLNRAASQLFEEFKGHVAA